MLTGDCSVPELQLSNSERILPQLDGPVDRERNERESHIHSQTDIYCQELLDLFDCQLHTQSGLFS